MDPAPIAPRHARLEDRLRGLAGVDFSDDAPPFAPAVPMDLGRFLQYAEQMARVVGAVHERGVTHRDIRPANFRLRDDQPVLAGFRHAVTFDTECAGFAPLDRLPSDVAYLAPEQSGRMNRPVDYRADLYALGGMLYSLATGRAPFPGRDRAALIQAHLAAEPQPPGELAPWMPPVLSQILTRLLAKEPEDRYQSASGLADDLRQLREAAVRHEPLDRVSLRAADRVRLPRLPRRRHGRDNPLDELLVAFDSVVRGGRESFLLSGAAGVGKTSLVNELQRPVALRAGRFVRGKCEQFQRHRPLLAPVQALQQLLALLLGEPEEKVRALRLRCPAVLGPDVGALIELLPELSTLTGQSAPPTALDPREAQIRLTGLLVRFIRLVTSPAHPLVLVLDDLQWADQPTLDFFAALLEEDDLDGLFLVGLYRGAHLDDAPALRRLVEKTTTGPQAVAVLHLENLSSHDLARLIGEMLGVGVGEILGLAAGIHRTTQGNPFHAIELVQALYREGSLRFDEAAQRWVWDEAALSSRSPAAGIVEFLTGNLTDLPPATTDALVAAACLGADNTLGLFAQATGQTVDAAAAALLPALERGVLVTPDAGEFSNGRPAAAFGFCHDRLQQAAALLRDEAWRVRLQLGMARRLVDSASNAVARLRAAEHYAEAVALLENPEEKESVAALFLEAGRSARETGAFAAARRFFRRALDLLAPDPWSYAPALAWDLHSELHLVCYCLPDYAEADAAYAELSRRSAAPEHLAAPACVQVMSLSNRTRYEEAVQIGAVLLGQLGTDVPLENPAASFEAELDEVYRALETGALGRLAGRPRGDANHAGPKLLNRMVPAAFFCRPELANWLVVHAARLWLSGHYDDAHIYPMACLALASIPARGDYASGYQAARAALEVGEADERGVETARARHVFGLFNCHWFEPLEHSLAQAREAYDALLRCGELEFACYTFFTSQAALLDSGDRLAGLDAENRRAIDFAAKAGNRHARESYAAFRHLLDALTVTDHAEEDAEVPASNPMAACFHHTAHALSACLFGQDEALVQHASEAVRLSPYITGFYPTALINVLESLALLARQRAGHGDPASGQRVAANQEWLAARAADAPVNFSHLHDLVEAERLAADGRGAEALPVYERALRRAKVHHRPWHAALAAEKAARCYLSLDLELAGHRLLEQARALYADWGAARKCAALEVEFPFLAAATGFRELQPVFSAMQQLSSMRSVPQLCAAAAEILHNFCGATDVQVLALDERDRWSLKAGFAGAQPLARLTLDEAEQNAALPSTVLHLGLRTLRPVLSDDAVLDPRLAGDPRFQGLERCAVLGVPVVSQNRAVAFVILENRRLRGAFTRELADLVGMLCGQLAVSIENARLYHSLEDKVEERTIELRAAEQTIAQTAYELTAHIPVGTYVLEFDPEGKPRFTFVSERFLKIVNLRRADVLADHNLAMSPIHPDEREAFHRLNAEVYAEKKRFFWEGRLVVRGETRWVTIESTPRARPGGGTIWEGTMIDVTDRKKAEDQLRLVLNHLPIAVAATTLTSPLELTFINEQFTRVFGYTLEEVSTVAAWAEKAYPDEVYRREVFREWDQAVFRAIEDVGRVESMEFSVTCKDGSKRDIIFGAVVLEDRLLASMTDVTARKQAEEALASANRNMQLAASAARLGFWEFDVETGLDRWDEEMARINGVALADFDGHWEKFVHPDDYEEVMRQTRQMRESDEIFDMDYRIVRPSGQVRHVREHGVVSRDGSGRALRVAGILQDITEEKEAAAREQRLEEEHRRDLENKLKTSLTASAVAHEINQPLSSILLQSKMALRQGEDEREALRVIAEEAQRVVVTIDKMKTLLRSVQTEHHEIDLCEVIQSALLYNNVLLARHRIKLLTAGLDQPCRMTGDDAQLQLAITNLLRNAAEAIAESKPKKREITINLTATGHGVELVIGDSGPGWPAAGPAEGPLTTTKESGTGIGLYVVRTAVANHRGEIAFGRSPLGGAEVRLKFPRAAK